jgi:hypothetical protein
MIDRIKFPYYNAFHKRGRGRSNILERFSFFQTKGGLK